MNKRSLTVGSLKKGITSSPDQPKLVTKDHSHIKPGKPAQSESQKQSFVKVIQNQKTIQVSPQKGTTLLSAALEQKQPIEYKCTKGTCGRCTVRLAAGGELLSGLNEQEQVKLKGLVVEGYRLACQAVFK